MILAQAIELNDPKIIEQAIIRLTLHEVGHTLGLNHNFKGSYLHNIEDVHNPEITSKIGVTASVMEYPAINLAPLGVKQGDYYDTIPGPYDIWAIRYGYTPDLTESDLEDIISEQHKPEHMFANDSEDMRSPGRGIDPRAMINDLTNDPMTYAEQRIKLVNDTQAKLVPKLSDSIETFEEFGITGVHLEDQIERKRCGHLENKELISTDAMVKKIIECVATKKDPNLSSNQPPRRAPTPHVKFTAIANIKTISFEKPKTFAAKIPANAKTTVSPST